MNHTSKYFFVLTIMVSVRAHAAEHETCWMLRPSDHLNKYANLVNGYVAAGIDKVVPSAFICSRRMPEDLLYKMSEMKAKRIFWDAYSTVPAYQEFASATEHFSSIPFMTQESYLKRYALEKTCRNGRLPALGFIDSVAGGQGASSIRVSGESEVAHMQNIMNFIRDTFLDHNSYVYINMSMPHSVSLGVQRDVGYYAADAYETLKALGAKQKYLIVGDSASLKIFLRDCPVSLKNFDVTFFVEGGLVTHALRAYFVSKGIKNIIGGYGVDDIRPLIGIQDDYLYQLQERCWHNLQFAQELTGCDKKKPYLYYYNPLDMYVEEIEGRLIFTDLDCSRVSPRIRYDAHVEGSLIKMSQVAQVLKHHGVKNDAKVHLPIMCVWHDEPGIEFDEVPFTFEALEIAVLMVPELARITNRQTYNQVIATDSPKKLEYWIELKEGINSRLDIAAIETKLNDALSMIIPAYKQFMGSKSGEKPALKIFAYDMSPMPTQKKA